MIESALWGFFSNFTMLAAALDALNSFDSLDGKSPWYLHVLRNISLILISLLFLPFSTFILLLSYALQPLLNHDAARRKFRRSPAFRPKKILVTGVSMAKGLILARAFHDAGHDVIGADFEIWSVPVNGRFSRAVRKFYALPKPNQKEGSARYLADLVAIVEREKVDLWVSCSAQSCAVEDGQAKEVVERRFGCVSIQFDVETTKILHEKNLFLPLTHSLGLPVPETYTVTSRAEVHKILQAATAKRKGARRKQYILKSVAIDDLTRMDLTPLPRRTMSETYHQVAKVPISSSNPWLLQQYIQGKEYCTHALVVQGSVKSFVACPSSDLVMHYEALPASSPLSKSMLRFTQEFLRRTSFGKTMIGHLSFDFLIDEIVTEHGIESVLRPIECNPRTHTAVTVAFQTGRGREMVEAYLSALDVQPPATALTQHLTNGAAQLPTPPYSSPENSLDTWSRVYPDDDDYENENENTKTLTPTHPSKSYWFGHDIVTLLFISFLHLLLGKISLTTYLFGYISLFTRVLTWKEGTFEVWDPLPWWWLYHIYWPSMLWAYTWTGTRWTRLNVSTGRYFAC